MTTKASGKKETQTVTPADLGPLPTSLVPAAPRGPLVTIQGPTLDKQVALSDAAQAFLAEAKTDREKVTNIPLISLHHREAGFVMPTGEVVAEVSGYPIMVFRTRKFYKRPPKPGEKGAPPDCWSSDLTEPHASSVEKQAEACEHCPMNQFGTGRDGRSKACGTFTWLFILNPEFGSPPIGVLVAPPSSLRAIYGTRFQQGYLAQATAKHGCYEIVFTTFSLKQEGDPNSVQYCTLQPKMAGVADLETAKRLVAMRNQFKQVMDAFRMKTPEVAGSGEEN